MSDDRLSHEIWIVTHSAMYRKFKTHLAKMQWNMDKLAKGTNNV